MAYPVEPLSDVTQSVEKTLAVQVRPEDRIPAISPGGQVIDGTIKFDPERTGHDSAYAQSQKYARNKT